MTRNYTRERHENKNTRFWATYGVFCKLYVAKTESMLFGTVARLKNVDRFQIEVHGHTIRRVFEFSYLGPVVRKVNSTIHWIAVYSNFLNLFNS